MPQAPTVTLDTVAALLPHPPYQLLGRRPGPLVLPDNIVCFQRQSGAELNRPRRGRALHHRFVLMMALRGTVGVCVDDRIIQLRGGEGLLVFPFQFHHYVEEGVGRLFWLFITFDLADAEALQSMQYRPFTLTPPLRLLATELIQAYRDEGRMSELPALLLAILLARMRRQGPAPRHKLTPLAAPGMVMQVNQLAHRAGEPIGIKEMAHGLGISQSHLRARFRASCGVSLGKHLRRLRLERACGLLRLTPNRISEIAEQCGFNSIYSFSRAFRSAYQLSPMAYRQSVGPHGGPRHRRPAAAGK
ncbi:MAG TPA: helix-turn-helix transcriptional regulator [Candidatus Didemnitutus sp.]|nr:helix-turn-helix transcriptional regulator [Candidatus Didemnitutus sp.]